MKRPGGVRGRGFVLVELLLVVAIILLVAGAYYGLSRKSADGEGRATTTPGQAVEAAKSVECANNLRQLRMLVQSEASLEGEYPSRLNAENGGSFTHCPVSGKPYSYDPRTGRVWCTTAGHESL